MFSAGSEPTVFFSCTLIRTEYTFPVTFAVLLVLLPQLVLDVIESEKLVLDAGGDPSLPLWDTVGMCFPVSCFFNYVNEGSKL